MNSMCMRKMIFLEDMTNMNEFNIPIFRGRDKKRIILYGEREIIIKLAYEFKYKGTIVNDYICNEDLIPQMKRIQLRDLMEVDSDNYMLIIASIKNTEYYSKIAEDNSLAYYTIEELSHFYDNVPIIPCHTKMLSIDSLGNVFPCCKIINDLKIGNICENDIIEKIKNYGENSCVCGVSRLRKANEFEWNQGVSRLALELCGPCQADCTYCYENVYDNFKVPFQYLKELEEFLTKINCKQIVAYGGELLCQTNVIEMFERIKLQNKELKIDIPTNGNFDSDILDRVENIVNEFEISFSGFSNSTYSIIMNISLKKTKEFVYEIERRKKNSYVLKMLVSPICIAEINDFLKWSLKLNPSHIVFHIADVYKKPYKNLSNDEWEGDSFSGCNKLYWDPLLKRIKLEFEKTIIENKELILLKNIHIVVQKKLLLLLNIDNNFWEKNGLVNNFGAVSSMILNGV